MLGILTDTVISVEVWGPKSQVWLYKMGTPNPPRSFFGRMFFQWSWCCENDPDTWWTFPTMTLVMWAFAAKDYILDLLCPIYPSSRCENWYNFLIGTELSPGSIYSIHIHADGYMHAGKLAPLLRSWIWMLMDKSPSQCPERPVDGQFGQWSFRKRSM